MYRWWIGLLAFAFACVVLAQNAQATVIRFETNMGAFDVNLFDDEVPGTVNNFLSYVTEGRLDGSLVHRKVNGFVIQGGGYLTDQSPIASLPPIPLEKGRSNRRGTIAMARTTERDSATSQWFINLVDNVFLDTQSGGYAVFGEVMGDGMTVVDSIASLESVQQNSVFTELPLRDVTKSVGVENFVVVNRVQVVPEPMVGPLTLVGVLGLRRRKRQRDWCASRLPHLNGL